MNPILRALALLLLAAPVTRALSPEDAARFGHDLDLLARELPRRHANLFHDTPRVDFDAAVAALRERLPGLERSAAIVELARVVALARDGHTALFLLPFPGGPPVPGIHQLPLQLYAFPEGLRVVAITRTHAAFLGARVVAIGGVPVADALDRLRALLPGDNPMGPRDLAPFYLALPEVLQATGLSADAKAADFDLETPSGRHTLRLTPMTAAPDAAWATRLIALPGPREAWVGAGDGTAAPLWLSRSDEPWWFTRLPDGTTYAQINLMRETPAARFADFASKLLAAVPKDSASRLVLDLRLNRGGNGDLRWPLLYALIRDDAVNRRGRLFVITGRRTFSAAQLLASELERHTQAVFVGEPTGSSPNHWGELGRLALPETKLDVLYSRFRFSAEPGDRRPWIPPHVAAELTYADLANGHDPALAAIQQYRDPPRAADVLQPLLAQGQVRAAVDQFRRAAKAWRNPWRNLFERELNDLGYALLEQQKPDAAVAVLGLATELYPESANAWDSYGEACLAKGLRGRAAYGYARASRLDPGNSGASEALAQILGEE